MSDSHKPGLFSGVLALLGLIILVGIVIWGVLHLATLAAPSLSSLFPSSPTIKISAPASAQSGEAFTVRWTYTPSSRGSYAIRYECRDRLSLEVPDQGGVVQAVPCGASYAIAPVSNTLSITPRFTDTSTVDVPLSILFIPSATSSKQARGEATVRVHPLEAARLTTTQEAPRVAPPSTATKEATVPADLRVTITSFSTDQSGNATLTFDIANIGGSTSGGYTFTAQLPTTDSYTYSSVRQSPLGPGDHMLNTLRFSRAIAGAASVSVAYSDANAANNYASQTMSGAYGESSYTQPAYYAQPAYYTQPSYTAQPYYQYQYNQPQPYYGYQQYPYYTY